MDTIESLEYALARSRLAKLMDDESESIKWTEDVKLFQSILDDQSVAVLTEQTETYKG